MFVSSGNDLQLLLEHFAAEWVTARMKICTLKCGNMLLRWKRVEGLLRVEDEFFPQVELYLGVLFTNVGKMAQEIERWISVASAVIQALYWSVVQKRKSKFSIYRQIYVPILTHALELWILAKRTRYKIQNLK